MTTALEAIRSVIVTDATIAALLTDVDGTRRVFPDGAPQGSAYPNVVMRESGGSSSLTQTGPDGLHDGNMNLDIFANDYDSARALARLLFKRLHGYSGLVGDCRLDLVRCGQPLSMTDDAGLEMEPPIYRQLLELEVDYYQE